MVSAMTALQYKKIIFGFMMTKQDYINFRIGQAEDDRTAVDTLFKGRNYLNPYSLLIL